MKAVAPKPVNVLISAPGGLTVADAAELGARRISVGGALARVAWGGFIHAAKILAENGTFDGFPTPRLMASSTISFERTTREIPKAVVRNRGVTCLSEPRHSESARPRLELGRSNRAVRLLPC